MSYPKLGFDMDGVTSRFTDAYTKRLIQTSGSNLFEYDRDERPIWTTWDMDYLVGYTHDQRKHAFQSISDDSFFWLQLEPYEDTQRALHKVSLLTDNLYFITHRMGDSAKVQSELWLEKFHVPNPTVLITWKKGLATQVLGLDYYVDDKPENVMDAIQHGAKFSFLVNRPWNEKYDLQSPKIIHVESLEDAVDVIKKFEN